MIWHANKSYFRFVNSLSLTSFAEMQIEMNEESKRCHAACVRALICDI